ncbi:putative WS beta-transducin repeats protein [Operophtera brumata]|uniref:Putative WS beta-transducin repeats protein n=1 Tax=Operophtera brumata TaxID=104452 RepID=A0A0L7KU04_OPEBR|nr:putative WS beta-transducin repeats protein [Operophtera brumata]
MSDGYKPKKSKVFSVKNVETFLNETPDKVFLAVKVHEDDVIGFGISSNGKYMMSCSNKTDMVIWDLKGQQLDRLDTYLMSTHSAKISPCGRFVVASGFSPDIKVMEVCFTKNGDFKQVTKAYELTGHSSGIYDVAFDVDTSHIATISKDGTWKLYHTKKTGTYTQTANHPHIALSPNAEVLAVSVDNSVEFYDTYTGELYDTVENVHSGNNYTQGESPHVLETGTYTQTGNHPHIALSPNAEVLAVSIDNSVEFYDTYTGELYDTVENVHSGNNYTQGESPHVLETGTYTQTGNHPHIALSPNAEVLAVSVDNSVEFYDTYTGELYDTVENVHSAFKAQAFVKEIA